MAKEKAVKKIVKKSKKVVQRGVAYVNATYNNTKLSITDLNGNVVAWSNTGVVGFKGSKKSTAYAATKCGEDLAAKAKKLGMVDCKVIINGVGQGRAAAVKGIRQGGLEITMLVDKTPVPHGGVKAKKPRKV